MHPSKTAQILTTGVVFALVGLTGCDDPQITYPETLEAPVSLAYVDGDVCLPDVTAEDLTIADAPLPRCEDEGNGFGLVVNQRSDEVSVVVLGESRPRLVNLDARRPGITGIEVGRRPIDVAVTGGGTAAVVANQADQSLSAIDLWTLRPLEASPVLDGTPAALASFEDEEGSTKLLVASRLPNRLEIWEGPACDRAAEGTDRRDFLPNENCDWDISEVETVDLPARPTDIAIDAMTAEAWVVYGDLSTVSRIALDDDALGDGGGCLDSEDSAPCEAVRMDWNGGEDTDRSPGAVEVDVDPLGLFVYALDRANHRLLVFDRVRDELIDASRAMEPPAIPFRTDPGIPISAGSLSMSADVERDVLDGDARHILYRLGARVASDRGQLYMVGAVDIECIYEGDPPLDRNTFKFDPHRRADSDEANCLFIPQFPLDGDPDVHDDQELLDLRVIDGEGARVAVTPVFGLRDGDATDGRERGRAQCDQPEDLLQAMGEIAEPGTVMGCGSPLLPQPVAPGVEDDLQNYADVDRLRLMTFARTLFDVDGRPQIERSVYDLRLIDEVWTIAYEGALPRPGSQQRGLVDADEAGVFRSGGVDFCSAGVEIGDRLTIRATPADLAGCDDFEGPPEFRTYEIVDVGPFQVELAPLEEDDRAQELPRRECFDRGLEYAIRPHQQWIVVGQQSGMSSPWERDGDRCVLREGAESGLLEGRVETGDFYWGPYFSLRIREGDVQAMRGLSYQIRVERNFARITERFSPDQLGILPSQVLFTPDLGAGRWLSVVDAGGNYLFLRNLSVPAEDRQFVR